VAGIDRCVIVTRKTQLQELLQRHSTVDQTDFVLSRAGADISYIHRRHDAYMGSLGTLKSALPQNLKLAVIDRSFLPQFEFLDDVVIAIGQDGLVSNTAKYLSGQPLIGVNPEPNDIEGVLLPWASVEIEKLIPRVMHGDMQVQDVTLARAATNDGRELLAFNDLFIGQSGHASALYDIQFNDEREFQSSSGIIVSTGAGSTGWYKSIQTGAQRLFSSQMQLGFEDTFEPLARDGDALAFSVREPWPSKKTGTNIVSGIVTQDESLLIESRMASNGVIFSDGIEWDYLEFNSGSAVTISVAEQKARLVVK
jgi:hypothetical protein